MYVVRETIKAPAALETGARCLATIDLVHFFLPLCLAKSMHIKLNSYQPGEFFPVHKSLEWKSKIEIKNEIENKIKNKIENKIKNKIENKIKNKIEIKLKIKNEMCLFYRSSFVKDGK